MLGEMFPGRKLLSEAGEDGDGQPVVDPWDIDLDRGVVRLRPMSPSAPKAADPATSAKPASSEPGPAPE